MQRGSLLAAIACLMTASCTAPLVIPKDITFQNKMGYASDWKALADRTADKYAATVKTKAPNVFVAPGPADMPFAVAYREFLEQALIKRGLPVVENAADAEVLSFQVHPYLYTDRSQKLPADYATFWSTAYAIASQVRNPTIDTTAWISGAAGPALDILKEMNSGTNAEVTLTLSVTDRVRQHYLDSETFYVQPTDLARFYWSQTPASAAQTMPRYAGGLNEVALPVLSPR